MKKKIIIITIIIVVILSIVGLIIYLTKDKDKEFKIEFNKDKVLDKLKDEGFQEAEEDIYVVKLEQDNGTTSYIFNFKDKRFQSSYELNDFNTFIEYNYDTNIASFVLKHNDDRGTLIYNNSSKNIKCDSNILNWCEDHEEEVTDSIKDLIKYFNEIIE